RSALAYSAAAAGLIAASSAQAQLAITVPPGGATYTQDYALTGSNNTIDAAGNSATFSGGFSDATPSPPASPAISSSTPGGVVPFNPQETYTGLTTIGSGATLALAGYGSISSSSGVVVNGVFDVTQTGNFPPWGGTYIPTLSGAGEVKVADPFGVNGKVFL